jgi:hypothetical protein
VYVVVDNVWGVGGAYTTAIATNANPLGIMSEGDKAYFLSGDVGEVRIYNRGFSVAEVQHNRSVTRWRYA